MGFAWGLGEHVPLPQPPKSTGGSEAAVGADAGPGERGIENSPVSAASKQQLFPTAMD